MNRDDIISRLHALEDVQNRFILEREQVTRGISIAMINRENILLCGPPGIAKTTQVRLVALHIAGGRHFFTQLTPFSTVDDIYGPVDINAYKTGVHRRVSAGMLQEAHIAIVDEIYNGNDAVLKALMGPMNEGIYAERGTFEVLPLRTLMGTTNSVPKSDELEEKGLLAFHDRWLFRFQLEEIREDRNFLRMLRTPDIDFAQYQPDPDSCLTVEELDFLCAEADQVRVPSAVYDELLGVRDQMLAAHIPCSPRRWKQIRRALQTAALLDNRSDVQTSDLALLRHMLWSHPDEVPVVEHILERYLAAPEERLTHIFTHIVAVCGEFAERRQITRNDGDMVKLAVEARAKVQADIDSMRALAGKLFSDQAKHQLEVLLQRSYTYLRQLDRDAGF